MTTDVEREFALPCPACDKPMGAVIAQGHLGFQRAMVPAFTCVCRSTMYPATSEVELQNWVAMVVLEGGPRASVPTEEVPVCRDCGTVLHEGHNPYEDGWYCPECERFDLHPATRVEVSGFGTFTSQYSGTWAVPPIEREEWLRGVIVETLRAGGLSVNAEALGEPRAFARAVERLARVIRMIEESNGT